MTNRNSIGTRGIIIIILVLLLIVIFGIGYGLFLNRSNSHSSKGIEVPVIYSLLASSSDDKAHYVQTSYTIKIDDKAANVTASMLYDHISDIMSTFDYDMVTGNDSVDNMRSHVMEGLKEYIDEDVLEGVYITDIKTGELVNPPVEVRDSLQRRNEIFKGIFRNAK